VHTALADERSATLRGDDERFIDWNAPNRIDSINETLVIVSNSLIE
jgi:hypothetical protein